VDFTARIWIIFVHLQFGENKNVEAILYLYVSLLLWIQWRSEL